MTTTSAPLARGSALRETLDRHVLVADGAMGTMLQDADVSLADFEDYEGCNEILNVTRPDIVAEVHDAYLSVGVDCIETNTFGANLANLAEYGIEDRIYELAYAGARLARTQADIWSTPEQPRFVLGAMGPGTRLPTLGHITFAELRDAYAEQARGLINGGVDALLVETTQDLLQAKAAIIGCQRARTTAGSDALIMVQVTVEMTGTMLLGTEIGAALAALEPLGVDSIGLNCATGPTEMSEHLRTLSRTTALALTCMPNAGLPVLTADGAHYPLSPTELADAHESFVTQFGLNLVGGCCGTTPEHLRCVVDRVGHRPIGARSPHPDASVASLYQAVPLRQDLTYLSIGERTNANGSKAFRDAMLADDSEQCVDIARDQVREGAHLLDLCVDYVGRDGAADMSALAQQFATASTLPLVLDSTEPAVLQAGLERLGGRSVINSVNYEDGDGPKSRFARIMPLVVEHGAAVIALTIDEEGQARTSEWKVRVAERLIDDLTLNWGLAPDDILVDVLTFPIATGQEETRRDGIETLSAIAHLAAHHPRVHTVLGLSNISFGLNPAARQVLNSVYLHEAVNAGLTSAIVHTSKILPIARISDDQRDAALDLIYDRRTFDSDGEIQYDPLTRFLEVFEGVDAASTAVSRAEELAALPLFDRLERRIIDGERQGLKDDLDEALGTTPALSIVNDTLLPGMKIVGERFGAGQMQLPFVLQSAEVMKLAVAHLEPHMQRSEATGKGRILLATVKGDVHDIGKNLVDIILSNNGYDVVNLGIKQPITAIVEAAGAHDVDVIGMSGLLVKSTVVMKENLQEMNDRGIADRYPVILGGAALTRAYVEQDLGAIYQGQVRYARDAFEGLALMDTLMAIKSGDPEAALPALRERRVPARATAGRRDSPPQLQSTARSDVSASNALPTPPFWGTRVIRGIAQADYVPYLDHRALFMGQWGLKAVRDGVDYDELVATEGMPRLREWLTKVHTEGLVEPAVTYGYFPAVSEGNDLIIQWHEGPNQGQERARLTFPRQSRGRGLCLADFFRSADSGETDVVAFHLVTMGEVANQSTAKLFADDSYREYLELHGLTVQLTEALAEMWHARIREELSFSGEDSSDMQHLISKQGYRGSRYSFGYPACPDLSQQVLLMDLLQADRLGVSLSEEFQLQPEQSTTAIIVHHPEAKYFNAT
ncbi:MAG: methionine synthase [Candidatus Nanopelagicales bacterium]